MSLLAAWLEIVADWREVFPQQRTFQRGVRQALASLFAWDDVAFRALSGPTVANSGVERRSTFSIPLPVGAAAVIPTYSQRALPIVRNGWSGSPSMTQAEENRAIDSAGLLPARSSLSTFSCQPGAGLALSAGSLLVPLHRTADVSTRALPIRFEEVSRVKRPGKKASEEQKKQYKLAVKQNNLSEVLCAWATTARGAGSSRRAAQDPGAYCRRKFL